MGKQKMIQISSLIWTFNSKRRKTHLATHEQNEWVFKIIGMVNYFFFFFAFKWVYLNCSQSIAKSYSYRCLSGNSLRLNEKKISALYLRKGFLPFTLFSCWLKQFNEIINEICANQPISQVTCMHRVHNAFEKQFFFSRSFDSTIISWIISFNVRCVKHQA